MKDDRYISRLREVVGCGVTRAHVAGFADPLRLDKILEAYDRAAAENEPDVFDNDPFPSEGGIDLGPTGP